MSQSNKFKTSEIVYFDKPGRINTDDTIRLAKKRALELGLKHFIVASTTGKSSVIAAELCADTDIEVVVVTEHYGFKREGEWMMDENHLLRLKEMGIKVVVQSHMLSGVDRSISKELGGTSRVEAIAEAFRRLIGVGVKVCIESTIMAADSGAIPCGPEVEVIVVGGTSGGLDTAVVIHPAHTNNFFNLEVREYVCLPRLKKLAYKKVDSM
ncbi:MAG: pyruvate kinase alpha/beta domain-containing protein [Candidatus Thorarchaeota archaeon]